MKSRAKRDKAPGTEKVADSSDASAAQVAQFHWQVGWWSLLAFLSLGIVLETLHGFKVGWYLDVSMESRRLMWTLAHTHGTLISLIHLAFAAACQLHPFNAGRQRTTASNCLLGAGILMPLGFFVGGLNVYEGDPGLGVLLVPPGGLLLFIAVLMTALGTRSAHQ
ncbi:MAG: hypothetical protein CMJ64_16285 [Planctomycetaceae bacterium]|nr:hypothetical protein [Planctomycetaceae bacterium]